MPHLGCWTLPVLMTVLLMTYYSEVTGAILNAPSYITLSGDNADAQMTVSCSQPTTDAILVMVIGKVNQNNVKSQIVKISAGSPTTVVVADRSLEQRMTQLSGSTSTGNLKFDLSDLRCTDAGSYYCSATLDADPPKTEEDTRNITARTYPGDIIMTVCEDRCQYNVGDLVEFKCNGLIGNQFNANNMASYWFWQWRYNVKGLQWTRFPNTNNITYEIPTAAANCQYNGRSRLYHTVTSADNGRQFRCYVFNNPDCGDNKTVYTETSSVMDRPCNGGDACQYEPKDFYCTQHTDSCVSLQWIYTGTKYSSFRFDFHFLHAKETNWKAVNTSEQNAQLQTLHTVKVTQLQSDSLIYFRLSAGGGQAGQCGAVTATCFTRDEPNKDTSSYSLGVGIAIGMGIMLLCGGLCILIAFIYRRKVASGGVTNKKPATVNLHQRPAPPAAQTETNPTADGEYEMPGNFYDGLQGRSVNVPTTYDELRTYQNT